MTYPKFNKISFISFFFLFSFNLSATGFTKEYKVSIGSGSEYPEGTLHATSVYSDTNNRNYSIKGDVKGFKGDKVMLASIANLRMNPIDTSIVTNGKFEFNISKRRAGMYCIIFDYGIYADIIINNEDIEFTSVLLNNNVEDSISFTKSEENKIYYEYQKYKKWVNNRAAYEKHQGSEWYSKDPVGNAKKLDSLKLHIDWLERSISDKAYELYKEYPSMFVAKKLKFYLLPNYEDYKSLNHESKYNNEFEFLQKHFYDNIDVKDTNLLDVAYLNNLAMVYLSNYTVPQNTKKFIRSCDFILEKMKDNKEALCSVLDVVAKQMDNWDQDSVYVHLSDNYYEKGYCNDNYNKQDVITLANMIKRLSKGNLFPDIILKDSSETSRQLHSLSNKITLVFFWLSSCDHCEKMIQKIENIYDTYKEKGFEVYAVSMDDNRNYWTAALKQKRMNWINVAELKGFKGEVAKQFNISKTPRLYLIDKDKKVISRPLNADQLQKIIENYFLNTD